MRKNIKKFAGIVLCIGMFTGCAQTPDSSLVKPKGSKAVDAYTEADDVSGSKGEASESKNDDGSESKTTIRNLIDAPQNYKSHVEDDSAKLVVNTDASVEIPEVEKISAIESMTYSNPYTIGNIKTENLNLLSFSEIMKIYEKMMLVTNADNMQYENSRVYNIDRIVLGYARIYEPSTDAHTGILIPVWDFFGSMTSESEYNGETESNTSKDPNESFLTINAVDGSIIDRNLGY